MEEVIRLKEKKNNFDQEGWEIEILGWSFRGWTFRGEAIAHLVVNIRFTNTALVEPNANHTHAKSAPVLVTGVISFYNTLQLSDVQNAPTIELS